MMRDDLRRWALVFGRSRRQQRRSEMVKQELGQGVDHFRRAAALAAQETGATVGPKINAARDRVQPIAEKAAGRAKDTASSGWDSAVATLTPLVAAASDKIGSATDSARQVGKHSGKQAAKGSKRAQKKAQQKAQQKAQKNADKLQKRANKALGRKQGGRKTSRLLGLALLGGAIGAGAAYFARQRKAAQWDEYEPSRPVAGTTPPGAEDTAFEPVDTATVTVTEVVTPSDPTIADTPTSTPAASTPAGEKYNKD